MHVSEIFLLLLHFIGKHTSGLDLREVIAEVPWIGEDFEEIATFSDEELSLSHVQEIAKPGTTLTKITASEILLNPEKLNKFSDSFHSPCTFTGIFIAERNETRLLQLLKILLVFPKDESATEIETFVQKSFAYIIWPTIINSTGSSFENTLNLHHHNLSVPLDTDVFIITKNSNDSLVLWELYAIKNIEIFQKVDVDITQPYAVWTLIKYKWQRRNNFYGATIIATGTDDPIYEAEVNFTKFSDGTVELYNGMAVDIYRTFRDYLNFTEASIIGEYILENITDPNILGMETYLQRGDADIAITESGVSDEKSAVVTLLHSTTANWLEARFGQGPKSKWKFFLSPFDISVWVLIIVHLIVMVACVVVFRRIVEVEEEPEAELTSQDWWTSVQLNVVWALGTLCLQGWYDFPKKTPLRMLFLVASLTGFLLNAAYSGIITSQLSVKDPISLTFEKLINLSFLFFMENDFSFPVDPEKYPRKIDIITLYNLNDSTSAVANLLDIKSAMISYPEFFYTTVQHSKFTDAEACQQFTTIRVSRIPQLCSMAVKKLSPLKQIFNVKILFIWERGVLPRLNDQYKAKTQLKCDFDSHSLNPQSLSELFMAYLIIGVGIAASIGFLLIEILLAMFRRMFKNP